VLQNFFIPRELSILHPMKTHPIHGNVSPNQPLLRLEHVSKWYPVKRGIFSQVVGHIKAVNDVSFDIHRGEIMGLVGESGCGKSTLGRGILHLTKLDDGVVFFEGEDIISIDRRSMHELRKKMQIIFQDPYSSLNPRLSVGSMLHEALAIHDIVPRAAMKDRIGELLNKVGLNAFHAARYPHEFSSGQKQRIGIARALAVEPSFIVCDEPVSALDVSIQAQIINLLLDLRSALNLTYLFISHDLSVVQYISDRIAVMYLGKIVELGTTDAVMRTPKHPYTRALLAAAPVADPKKRGTRVLLSGDVPSPLSIPAGCPFHPRCPEKFDQCDTIVPTFRDTAQQHFVSCLLYESVAPLQAPPAPAE
jgi:oligopeptide/dipeptide ABC transporter ATP-binding protein